MSAFVAHFVGDYICMFCTQYVQAEKYNRAGDFAGIPEEE